MSDLIQPNKQNPTPCDFGPFAGRVCATTANLTIPQNTSNITISPIEVSITENETSTIDLKTFVLSRLPILWGNTVIGTISAGTATILDSVITFTPDKTDTQDRVVTFDVTVADNALVTTTGTIKVNITDLTPSVSVSDILVSGTENDVIQIDIKPYITLTNTTIDFTLANAVVVSLAPTEGSVSGITDGIITFIPDKTGTQDRFASFEITVTTLDNVNDIASVGINITDKTPELHVLNVSLSGTEEQVYTIDVRNYASTVNTEIDYTTASALNISTAPSEGTFTIVDGVITYTPDKTISIDRNISFDFKVMTIDGLNAIGTINVFLTDITPTLAVANKTLTGTEGINYTFDVRDLVTVKHTSIDYTLTDALEISVAPSEGTVLINNGVITYTPNQASAVTRTVTFKFRVKTLSGLMGEGNVSVTLTDITPAITARDFTLSLADNITKTFTITSNLTIKNDTFKNVTFSTPSEGTFAVTGASVLFTPDASIDGTRTVTSTYTATTNSGLTASGIVTITVTNFNVYANTIWFGNDLSATMDATILATLTNHNTVAAFAGTYSFVAGSGFKWLVYPKVWGEPTAIIDAVTTMAIAVDEYQYITVDGVELVCIKTYYEVNGAIQIKLL